MPTNSNDRENHISLSKSKRLLAMIENQSQPNDLIPLRISSTIQLLFQKTRLFRPHQIHHDTKKTEEHKV